MSNNLSILLILSKTPHSFTNPQLLYHIEARFDSEGAVVGVVGAGGCEERAGYAGVDAAVDSAAGRFVGEAGATAGEAQGCPRIGKAQDGD